jgi:SulP family sulfate permease
VLPALSGGAAVAVMGLALLLGVGALSVTALGHGAIPAGVVASCITGTVVALVVVMISRTPGEICGPRTSISVIYAALCADLVARAGAQVDFAEVFAALAVAVVIMGMLEIAAGWLRLGDAIKFMPFPVNAGFVTGIGLTVVWSQVGPALGLQGKILGYDWHAVLDAVKPGAAVVACVAAATVWVVPLITKRAQPMLVGLATATLAHHGLVYIEGAEVLGPTLGTITPLVAAEANVSAVWSRGDPAWLITTALYVLPYSAFLALQGIMNAAVVSVMLAEVTGVRATVNRALVAQGVGNILAGGLGALPLGTSPSQSAVAGRMKRVSHIVPAVSIIVLLLALLALGSLLAYIPVAALAGLLITAGFSTVDQWSRGLVKLLWRGPRRDTHVLWNLAIVIAVAASFFFGSVPIALMVGAVLSTILLAVNLSAVTTFDSHSAASFSSTRVWPAEQAQWLSEMRRTIRIFRPRGSLFFATADQLSTQLAALPPETRYCVLDVSRLTTLDATGCNIVASSAKKLAAAGVTTLLAGLDVAEPRAQTFIALGLIHPEPQTHWFDDLDHALEWIECELVAQHWPDTSNETKVPLRDTPLARGLSQQELEELTRYLTHVEHDAGPLFRRGDAGSSMYVIDEGAVEIRIGDGSAGKATRLASFGPGSIFGEVAMLTFGERSADAVCLKPTRLYELRRDALSELETHSPRLYARIMANLNAHLANRLVIATSTVQAQR